MKFLGIMVVVAIPLLAVMSSATADSFSGGAGNETMGMTTTSRKLRAIAHPNVDDTGEVGHVSLEDYRPYDPVPSSSKASVRPGPIQHGTPLMPFIPRPSPPPGHPKLADSP